MPKPFERLRQRLLAAGVGPRHVRRYLAELNEHLDDLKSEEQGPGRSSDVAEALAISRLGSDDMLVSAATAQPTLLSWTARAPWAAFLVAPPIAFGAIFALTLVCMVFLVQSHRRSQARNPTCPGWFFSMCTSILSFESLGLPVLIGWGLASVAIRQRVRSIWPLIGLITIAVIGATFELSVEFPQAPGQHGEIGLASTIT